MRKSIIWLRGHRVHPLSLRLIIFETILYELIILIAVSVFRGDVVTMECVEKIIKKDWIHPLTSEKLSEKDIIPLQRVSVCNPMPGVLFKLSIHCLCYILIPPYKCLVTVPRGEHCSLTLKISPRPLTQVSRANPLPSLLKKTLVTL